MAAARIPVCALLFVFLVPALPASQPGGTISYKIDDRSFTFSNGRLEYYKGDGYISLTCLHTELVADPSGSAEKREVDVGMAVHLAGDEASFGGLHEASSPDVMPTHFSWYEIVPVKDKKAQEIKIYLAGLDSGDEKQMIFHLKIEEFGPPGSLVQGTFSGKLFDEEGRLHQIADGIFSVPRVDKE